MSGGPEALYVRARNALLDAADALSEQLDAVVLVGSQAIYLHTGDADFAIAEYTTDADFCVAPPDLSDTPLLTELLGARGFFLGQHPGAWLSPDGIAVDLMVPEMLAGPGSRRGSTGPSWKKGGQASQRSGGGARRPGALVSDLLTATEAGRQSTQAGTPATGSDSRPRSTMPRRKAGRSASSFSEE